MNKKQLINAFDSFNPTEIQKQKIYEIIKSKTAKKSLWSIRRIYIPLSYGVAALFVIAIINGNTGILRNGETTLLLNQKPQSSMVRTIEPAAFTMDTKTTNESIDKKAINESTDSLPEISPKIPKDMTITSESDAVNMTYIGNGARCINITLEYNSEKNKKYLEDEQYKKTNINGHDAVVFYDGTYTVYMDAENISYEIKAVEITEKELIGLLESIT